MTKDGWVGAFVAGADCALRVRRLLHGAGLPLPSYASASSAGMDLYHAGADTFLDAGVWMAFDSGIEIEIPAGHEGQIRPRSGMAYANGVTVLNAPGTIDSDYRGEVRVILINHGDKPVPIRYGDRIAQLVITPVTRVHIVEVNELSETERGGGGFGSTGR